MTIHIHTNYYQDNMEKRFCDSCNKSFVVGEELKENKDVMCPYCGSKDNEAIAWTRNEEQLNELGCAGIYFYKENGKYYDEKF